MEDLRRLLQPDAEPDARVRTAAVRALGTLGVATVEDLRRLLQPDADPDADVRAAAIEALGELGAAAAPAVDDLRRLIRSDDGEA